MENVIRIATRGSRLALIQSYHIGEILNSIGIKYKIVPVKSAGDKDLSKPLYEYSERGIFVKSVNEELLNGNADIAVHSAKDLPYDIGEDLELSYYSARGDTRDYFVSNFPMENFKGDVGGSSIRRKNFLRLNFKDFNFVNIRGNIDTRISKWKGGAVGALVMAKVAIDRLGFTLPGEIISEEVLPPAPNQGLIAVVTRKNSGEAEIFRKMRNEVSFWEGENERKLMGELSLGCNLAVSIRAYFDTKIIKFSYATEDKRYDLKFKGYPSSKDLKVMGGIIYG